jgi:hypothetical protein
LTNIYITLVQKGSNSMCAPLYALFLKQILFLPVNINISEVQTRFVFHSSLSFLWCTCWCSFRPECFFANYSSFSLIFH